jgi:hypothetical protein
MLHCLLFSLFAAIPMVGTMEISLSKILSVVVVLVYVLVAWIAVGEQRAPAAVLTVLVSCLFPLAMIWFPDELGDMTGAVRGGYIDRPSPGWLVAAFGWFFLVGMPIVIWLLQRPAMK